MAYYHQVFLLNAVSFHNTKLYVCIVHLVQKFFFNKAVDLQWFIEENFKTLVLKINFRLSAVFPESVNLTNIMLVIKTKLSFTRERALCQRLSQVLKNSLRK